MVPSHFLAQRHNQRTDEYGGSLENRLRLFRELLEDTKDAVGGDTAVVVRFAVDEMMGPEGLEWHAEGREAVEMLCSEGYDVSLVMPVATIAAWMVHTLEQAANQDRLADVGVDLLLNTILLAVEKDRVLLHDTLKRHEFELGVDGVVMVAARLPNDELYHELEKTPVAAPDTKAPTLRRIGDCQAPGLIATGVYQGHRYARELGVEIDPVDVPFRRERHVIEPVTA
jgi:hypothetical protein